MTPVWALIYRAHIYIYICGVVVVVCVCFFLHYGDDVVFEYLLLVYVCCIFCYRVTVSHIHMPLGLILLHNIQYIIITYTILD